MDESLFRQTMSGAMIHLLGPKSRTVWEDGKYQAGELTRCGKGAYRLGDRRPKCVPIMTEIKCPKCFKDRVDNSQESTLESS